MKPIRIAIVVALLQGLAALPVSAALFEVDTTLDESDVTPGDGLCRTADQRCSLRAALQEANATAERDTILLPPGTYPLLEPAQPLAGGLDLRGSGPLETTVDATAALGLLVADDVDVSITALTVRGGIQALDGVGLNLVNCRVVASSGNGIHLHQWAWLTIDGCTIEGNERSGVSLGDPRAPTVEIRNSTIRDNGGNGISNGDSATIQIDDTTLAHNGGFGIVSPQATLVLRRSRVTGNARGGLHIGLESGTTIVETSIWDNHSSDRFAGGVSVDGQSGGETIEIVNSTISGNTSALGPGGVWISAATSTIVSSTIVGNVGGWTGGIQILDAYSADDAAMRGTVVAGNRAAFGPNDCRADSLSNPFPTDDSFFTPLLFFSSGNNFVGDAFGCELVEADGDIYGAGEASLDPMVAPLAENGGPTPTHAPREGSPLIDAGGSDCPTRDQRGVARPIDGDEDGNSLCDIGAVERAWRPACGLGGELVLVLCGAGLAGWPRFGRNAGRRGIDAGIRRPIPS